jgi:hypothetical protein
MARHSRAVCHARAGSLTSDVQVTGAQRSWLPRSTNVRNPLDGKN